MSSPRSEKATIVRIRRDLSIVEIRELLEKSRVEGGILKISESEARKIEVCLRTAEDPSKNPDAILAGELHKDLRHDPTSIEFCSENEQRVLETYPLRQHTDTALIHALLVHDRYMRDSSMHVAGGFGAITAQQIQGEMKE